MYWRIYEKAYFIRSQLDSMFPEWDDNREKEQFIADYLHGTEYQVNL
jgi:hypothetical protein